MRSSAFEFDWTHACEFDSSMRRYRNATGEEGNGKPPREFHFPRKKLRALSLVSATLEIEYATQLTVLKVFTGSVPPSFLFLVALCLAT